MMKGLKKRCVGSCMRSPRLSASSGNNLNLNADQAVHERSSRSTHLYVPGGH